jgi:hypothetical protein
MIVAGIYSFNGGRDIIEAQYASELTETLAIIEIVPIKDFANDMSTGVSYFEQFVWDLQQRGVSNIDIPVLILGVMGDIPDDDKADTAPSEA